MRGGTSFESRGGVVAVAVGGSWLASDAEKQGKGGGVSVLLGHSGKAGGSGEDLALVLEVSQLNPW